MRQIINFTYVNHFKPILPLWLRCAYNKLLFEEVKGKLNCCKMLVLDEVLDAVSLGYIAEDKLLEFLTSLCDTEVILTGHSISEKIKDICDYVSEIKEIKHPYSKGALPRKGIEF